MSKFGIVFEKNAKNTFSHVAQKQPKIEQFLDLLVLFKVYTFTTFFSVQKQISKRDQETRKEASKRTGDKNQPINLIKTHFLGLSLGPDLSPTSHERTLKKISRKLKELEL